MLIYTQSTTECANGLASFTRTLGRALISWYLVWVEHFMHRWIMLRIPVRALGIQYFCLKVARVSFNPPCSESRWVFLMMIFVKWWSWGIRILYFRSYCIRFISSAYFVCCTCNIIRDKLWRCSSDDKKLVSLVVNRQQYAMIRRTNWVRLEYFSITLDNSSSTVEDVAMVGGSVGGSIFEGFVVEVGHSSWDRCSHSGPFHRSLLT